jgi:hypothetical protein
LNNNDSSKDLTTPSVDSSNKLLSLREMFRQATRRVRNYVAKDDYRFGSMILRRRYVSPTGKERDIYITVTIK